ncbi:MAG: type II toxin-antitoxin system VapC family toxin [Deltaproteobacteria bacterium]|nr:type II toxin-antitoxin system VapC family toxin [Deltaproteobacteria bacterium]
MLALDTNVLVRFLVDDDAAQSAKARKVFERAGDRGLYLSRIVACETVWVLRSAYEFTRAEIAGTLTRLLGVRQLVVSDSDLIANALDAYADGKGDFADYLIREEAIAADCEDVVTFDRTLQQEPGFTAP